MSDFRFRVEETSNLKFLRKTDKKIVLRSVGMLKINNEISKSNITFITIQNKSVLVHVCFVLFTVCLYICVCERQLQNNNHKTKHKNDNNCGSAFEVGASGLPYYCVSICVRS